MSQRAVEQVLGKMVTDETFRGAFLAEPDVATHQAGLVLTRHEIAALRGIAPEALDALAGQLDGRICRLCVSGSTGRGEPSHALPEPGQP